MVAKKGFAEPNKDYLYPYPVYFRSPVTGFRKDTLLLSKNRYRAMGLTTVIRDYGTDILNAIRENDLHKLKFILEKTLRSDAKIAKLCVTDIKHKPTKKFACPLILAARQEDPRIMKYMMDKGTDPNFVHHTIFSSKRREIVTALHLAVDLGHYDTAEVLLNANADGNIYDHNRETPLHIAVKKADHTMMKLLLSKGADPLIPDNKNNAALHIATLYGHLQMVRTLLKYDADIYQKGQWDVIPPHIAAKEGHTHLVQLFSASDLANINVKIPCYLDKREKAPIHLAAENGHAECLSVLLDEFEADVNLKDSDGNTALHCVVLRPYDVHRMRDKEYFTQSARLLLKFRISINEKNIFGDTALHFAAMNHYHRIVELLLENGANPFLENEDGMKPIDTVPDSDPVTKQILKMAMLKGRPPLSASLSHQRHINESSFNNTTLQESAFDQSRSNISYKSVSSTSSVFINDTKPHRSHRSQESKPKSKLPNVEETVNTEGSQQIQQHQQVIPAPPPLPQHGDTHQKVENEINIYSKVNKKNKQKGGQELQRNLGYDQQEWEAISTTTMNEGSVHGSMISQHNTSKISREIKTGGHEQSQQQLVAELSDAVKHQNYINRKKRCNKHRPSSSERDDLSLDTAIPEQGQEAHWGQLPEKGEVIYENVLPVPAAESAPPLPPRKNRPVPMPTDEEQAGDVEPLEYNEEGGVQVHTLPGRPSAIEVQYKGGPITISVDTPKEYYEGDHRHKDSDNIRSPKMSSKQKRHPPSSPKQNRKHSASPKTKRKRDQTPETAQLYDENPEQQPMDVCVSLGRKGSPHKKRTGSNSQGTGQDYYTEYYRQKAMKKIKRKQKSKEGQEEPYNIYAEVEQNVEDYFNGTYDISELESLQQSMMSESPQPELIKRIIEQKIAELLEQKAKKVQKGQRPEDKMKQWLMETDEQDDETEEEEKQHILDSDEWNDDEEFQTPSKWLEMDESGSEDNDDDNEEDEENINDEDENIKMQEVSKVPMKSTPIKQHTTKVLRKQSRDSQIEVLNTDNKKSFTAESPSKQDKIGPRKSHPKLPKAQQLDPQADQHTHAEDSSPVQEDSPTRMTFQEKLAWAKAQEKKEAEAKGTPTKVTLDEKGGHKVQKKQDKVKQKEESEGKPVSMSDMIKGDYSEYYSLAHDIEGSTVSSTSASVGATIKDIGQSQIRDDIVVEQYEGSPFSQRKRNVGQADNTVNEITSPVTSRKRSKSQSDILDVNEDQGTVSPVTLQDINKKGIRTTSVLSEGSGLGLRVSGEVPKAYTHNDKSSARRAFMMANPVKIESNSECSDTELHGSKGSLSSLGTHKDRGKLWEDPIMKPVYPKHSSGLIGTATISDSEISVVSSDDSTKKDTRLIGGYAKPYKSFGKIEVKTDLIEEAMLNASIPEDPETVSDLEPFEVSDLEEEEQEIEQKTEPDITLPSVPVDASQGRAKSSKHLQIEMLDKEPRGAPYSNTQTSPQQPVPPLPLNFPPAIKPSESQLSPRSDTSSKSSRKVVSVKEQRRGEHGDIIETITTTVIKHEMPQPEVAIAEMVAPTDDLSFDDSTFDDLDELVMQNMQVKALSELPPPPPELMKSDDSQELLNPLTDKTNKLNVDIRHTDEDKAQELVKKTTKSKKKSKKSAENLTGESSESKKKKKKKTVKAVQGDNNQTEEVAQVEKKVDLEAIHQEPALVRPKKVSGVPAVIALGENGVPLRPSEVAKMQKTEMAAAQSKKVKGGPMEDMNYEQDDSVPKITDGKVRKESVQQDISIMEYDTEPGSKTSHGVPERGRTHARTSAGNIVESKPEIEFNQSLTDMEVAQITDAAEERRKAREAARAQRLWHKKMIEEGKDPQIMLKSRSHSRETFDDQPRKTSPSPTRRKVTTSPDTYTIVVEGSAEVNTSKDKVVSISPTQVQGEEVQLAFLGSKKDRKKKAKKSTESLNEEVEKKKKKKKKKKIISADETGSLENLVAEKKKKKKKKTNKQSDTDQSGVENLSVRELAQPTPPDTVISHVWKEAMEGQPLASSETVYEEQEEPLNAGSDIRRSRRGRRKKRGAGENDIQVGREMDVEQVQQTQEDGGSEPSEAGLQDLIKPATVPEINKPSYESAEDDYDSDQENESKNVLSMEMSVAKRAQLVSNKELNRQQQKLSKLGKKYKLIESRAGVDEEQLKQEQRLVTLDRSPQAGKQEHQKPRSQHAVQLQQAEDELSEDLIIEEPLPDSLIHRAEVPKITHDKQASHEACNDEDLLNDLYSEDIPVASMDLTSEQREAMMRAREARKQQQIKKSLTRQMQTNENLEEQDVLMEHPLPVSDGRMSQRAAQARRPQAVELQQNIDDPRLEDDHLPEDFIKKAVVPDLKNSHGDVYKTDLDHSDELEVVTEQGQSVNLTEAQQAELRKAKEVRRLQQSLDKIAQRRQQKEQKPQPEHGIQDKEVPLDKKMPPPEPKRNKHRNYAMKLAQQHDELPTDEDDDDSSSLSENLMKKAIIPTSSITRTFDFSQEETDDECHDEQPDVITANLTEEQRASIAKAKEEKRRAKVQEKQEKRNKLEIEEKGEYCVKVEEMETQEVETEVAVPDKQQLDEEGYLLPQPTHKHAAIKLNQPYQGEDEYTEITETMPDYEIRRAKAPNLPPRQTFETDIDQDSHMPYQEDAFKSAAFAAMKEMQNQNSRARDDSEDTIGQSTAFTRSSSGRIRVKRGARPKTLPQDKETFIDMQPDLIGEDALPPDGNTDAQLQEELARLQRKEPASTPLMSELWQEKKDQESEMQLMLQSVQDVTELQLTNSTGHLRNEQNEQRGNLPQLPTEPLPTADSAKTGQKQSPTGSPYKPPRPPQKVDKRPPPGPHLNDSLHTSLGSQGTSPQGSLEMAVRPRSFSEGKQYDPQLRAGPEGKSPRHMQPVKRRIRRAYPSDGELYSGNQSDSEAIRKARRAKSISFYGDFRKRASEKRDRPPKITASQSLEEAAWQQIRQEMEHQPQIRPHRVIKPHSDKPINYTRGIYRPTPIYWRGSQRSFANTSRYDDSELIDQLWNERHRSMTTESEGDADLEDMSYDANMPEEGMHESHQFGPDHHVSFTQYGQSVSDDEHVRLSQYSSAPQLPASGTPSQGPPGQYFGAFQPIGPPKKVTIVDKKKHRVHEEHKDLPPRMMDPGPVDFKNYGAAAKLWMEQVDKTDMQKSKTMYLSMMGNQQPPPEIMKSLPDDDLEEGGLGSQWVIARGRSLRRAKHHYDQQRQMDSDADQGCIDPGKQMLLFFKIGENWKDLAWVLFDGLQSDGDTLRMLKEIQHRHPDKINDQVHDMMHRWWKKKGSGATIEELQRGLEVLKMAYVEEEYINPRGVFSETETELDISTASEDDAEVNRLIYDYKTRSLNASFENKNAQNAAVQLATPESSTALSTDNLLRKLEEAAIDHIPAKINRSSITMSSPQPPSKPRHEDSHGESDYDSSADGTHRHSFVIIQPQLDSKEYKHETNM